MRIDLNSDLGESFGPWPMGQDASLMDSITSANIACGFHAGDPGTMRRTLELARNKGVAVGAHPGFPDLVGFGRREMKASPEEVHDFVLYQVAALAGIAQTLGVRLQHVKAHGALYNMACKDRLLADAIARAVAAFDRSLILFGLPNSELLRAGEAAGLPVAAEVFADRDAGIFRQRKGLPHHAGVAGVEPAGDVGGGNAAHQGRVLAHRPRPERLAEIRVEINSHFVLDRPNWSAIGSLGT